MSHTCQFYVLNNSHPHLFDGIALHTILRSCQQHCNSLQTGLPYPFSSLLCCSQSDLFKNPSQNIFSFFLKPFHIHLKLKVQSWVRPPWSCMMWFLLPSPIPATQFFRPWNIPVSCHLRAFAHDVPSFWNVLPLSVPSSPAPSLSPFILNYHFPWEDFPESRFGSQFTVL